jgi:hypothetical protein
MEELATRGATTTPPANLPVSMASSKCIFCGGQDVVATAIWPEWLNLRCPDTGGPDQVSSHPLLSLSPRLVCTRCGDGWMAALDAEAEQILGPVLDGTRPVVTGGQMKVLAGWLCLLAIKLAAGSGKCLVAPTDRSHVRNTRRPPQNWGIFVAGFGDAGGSRSCEQHPCRIEFSGNPIARHSRGGVAAACNTQTLSIRIGPLFFHLFSSPSLITVHDFIAASSREGLTQIWPPHRRFGLLPCKEIRLPPERTLTEQEAHRVAERFMAQVQARLKPAKEAVLF